MSSLGILRTCCSNPWNSAKCPSFALCVENGQNLVPACSSPGCLGGCGQAKCRSSSPGVRHSPEAPAEEAWVSVLGSAGRLGPPVPVVAGGTTPSSLPLLWWVQSPGGGRWGGNQPICLFSLSCVPHNQACGANQREVRRKYYRIHFGEKDHLKIFYAYIKNYLQVLFMSMYFCTAAVWYTSYFISFTCVK